MSRLGWSGTGGRRRRVAGARLVVGRSQVARDGLVERAVALHLLDRVGDLLAQGGVALLEADAVVLGRERLADELELALVLGLRGEAGQDRVVGRQGVHAAGGQGRQALGVRGELLQLHGLGELVLDLLCGRRALNGAELLAVEAVGTGDRGVLGANEEVLTCDEVRTCEGGLLLALVGDGVGRDDELDLTGGDEVLALRARSLHPRELVLGGAELLRDVLGDVDVHAGVVRALLEAETGLVELDADLEALGSSATAAASAAAGATRGEREPQRRSRRNGSESSCLHLGSSLGGCCGTRCVPLPVDWCSWRS